MSKLSNKRVLLAKIGSVYGTDAVPTGSANAILVRNFSATKPITANLVDRTFVRPFLGGAEQLPDACYSNIEFEVELAGAGGAGATPKYDCLLRACGFSATASTNSLTSITRTGSTATATRTAHGFAVGDSVVISGATETEYNGTFTVATVPTADTFTYTVTGTPTTPATGTPVIGNQVLYAPVSDSFEWADLYYNKDGRLHKLLGCRGSVSLQLNAKSIPVLMFKMTGLYATPTDTAAPSVDYTGFTTPTVVNQINTPTISFHGYSPVMSQLSVDTGNTVVFRSLPGGSEQVLITGRKVTGSVQIEDTTVAAKDWWTLAKSATTAAMTVTHGTLRGNQVTLAAPHVQLTMPDEQDLDGIAMLNFGLNFVPGQTSGNDEFTLAVR